MASNELMLQVSAFSGLAGALLTQGLTGLFSYLGDKRKSRIELKQTYRNKQVEIAENFYFVTGEKIAIVKKNIDYWKNYNSARSTTSLNFLNQELKKLMSYMEKLDQENWKYNLVGLYFNVSLDNEVVNASNIKSKELYLQVVDLTEELRHSLEESKGDLYLLYDHAINQMCEHYQELIAKMYIDMKHVKESLLKELQ